MQVFQISFFTGEPRADIQSCSSESSLDSKNKGFLETEKKSISMKRGKVRSMKTYAIAGAGARARAMFAIPLARDFSHAAKLAGLYDKNLARAKLVSEECGGVPIFDSFEEMLEKARPDTVIVTTPDATHHEYIVRALRAGCDVISEKPLTTDMEKCREIMRAEQETGRQVTVTFNCRFMPYVVRIKELLSEGVIGNIHHVSLQWMLDRSHGADYFRRWHRRMKNSGGLLVHKATHHFDMVNWWLDDEPETIQAFQDLRFYGPNRKERGTRCLDCRYKDSCEFYFDITKHEFHSKFYHAAESEDGYIRDQCVFGDDIDIYDTMSLNVRYKGGALLTYSLVAYSAFEGWKLTVHGDKGRLEAAEYSSGLRRAEPTKSIDIYPDQGNKITYTMTNIREGHGGGDERLRKMLFEGVQEDPLKQMADTRAGAMSLVIGAGANIASASGQPVHVKDLFEDVLVNQ